MAWLPLLDLMTSKAALVSLEYRLEAEIKLAINKHTLHLQGKDFSSFQSSTPGPELLQEDVVQDINSLEKAEVTLKEHVLKAKEENKR